ncbi:hypothetical protein [Weissella cibaria]|uniref:hypothetical protein n=1 Tax=Weissella cibaria TaxID=137591 RepID=UPI001FF4DECF|nr:hypothetical protein [Weissella cibaria]UOX37782.1 hypothetical protein IDM39_05800 [Weissella cibaria]
MMTFLFSLFSLIAAAVSFAGYKTIFKIEENDEDVADVVSAKVASHKHDANNGMLLNELHNPGDDGTK